MTPLDLKLLSNSNLTLAKYSQAMISFQYFFHSEPLGPMIREILGLLDVMTPLFDIKYLTWLPFCFQKPMTKSENYSQASFPSLSLSTFCANLMKLAAIFKVLKHLIDFRTIGYGSHLDFKMRTKCFTEMFSQS